MDPALLARLPDAAKLGILRHLTTGSTQYPTVCQPAQQPAGVAASQQGASPSPASPPPQHVQLAAAAAGNPAPELVQKRRLAGGLAVIDGFLDEAEVEAAREEARAVLAAQSRAAGMVAASASASSSGGGGGSSGGGDGGAEPRTWASAAARGDRAAWLSTAELRASGRRRLAGVVQSLLALRPWLEQQGYDVGGQPSVQLACYPGGGARYVRHRDASASVPRRTVTAILYLNQAWEASHGGALCVYNHSTVGGDPRAASPADLRLASSSGGDGSSISSPNGLAPTGSAAGLAPEGRQEEPAAQLEQEQQAQQRQDQAAPAASSGLDEGHPATVVPPRGGRLVVMDSRLLHEVLPAGAERYAVTVWFSRTAPAQQQRQQPGQEQQRQPGQEQQRQAQEALQQQQCQELQAEQQQQQQQQQQAQTQVSCGRLKGLEVQVQAAAQQQRGRQPPDAPQPRPQGGSPARQPVPGPVLDAAAITAPGCIFVSIPAYRDSEAQWTLADLFAKAAHPERVRVGIVWQVELPGDADLMRLAGDQRRLAQVRQVVLPAGEATGPCKARALAQQLWEGEEYHLQLQIDSHMRFTQGWDAALLRMLRQAEATASHPRVVLSTYPPGYEGEGPAAALPPDPLPAVLCASHFGQADGLLRTVGRKLREPLAAPAPALFWAAGFSFSRAQLIQEAPYPRNLPGLFFGEEMLQLQCLWCAGWDVFTPPTAVAFHLWSRKHRPTFQAERRAECEALRQRSQAQVAAALAGEGRDADMRSGSSSGGGGGELPWRRSLEQFWQHVGVDFRPGSRAVSERARNAGWPAEAFLASES